MSAVPRCLDKIESAFQVTLFQLFEFFDQIRVAEWLLRSILKQIDDLSHAEYVR
jgi:hypothetical protein